MRADLTSKFIQVKDLKSNEPVTLLRLDWPSMNGLPALTLRLTDRAGVVIGGVPWFPLIEDAGDIRRLVDTARLSVIPSTNVRVGLVNLATDLFSPSAMFSRLFRSRPPESCVATISQWFAGLSENDIADLFVGAGEDPIKSNQVACSFNLVNISTRYGRTMIGEVIDLDGYPLAPESSVGKMKPIILGVVDDAPSLLVRKTVQTVLRSVALPGTNILDVASTEDFAVPGIVIINDDEVAYTAKNSTQFLNCTGINEFHYADDVVLEKNIDHRYLLSDPAYPIKSISNVKVAGHLVDAGLYTINLVTGEVVFTDKPVGSNNIDTKFLQAQFTAVGAGNNAVNPLNAAVPAAQTTYAKINSVNNNLSLKHAPTLANIGIIGKVLVRVEHFVESKLPNDHLELHITGIGKIGDLSPPATDDQVVTVGSTNIIHSHLDTFGFPISDPQHFHAEAQPPKIAQNALGGASDVQISSSTGHQHIITFPDPGAGTWATGEYGIGFQWTGNINGPATVEVFARNNGGSPAVSYKVWKRSGSTETYTTAGIMNTDINSIKLTHNATFITYKVITAVRIITMTTPLDTTTKPTANTTSKTGALTQHSSSPALNATTDSATRSVVDFYDITSHVNGDWNWFTGKEAQVKYIGGSDGRTVFVVHLAWEIEYARRRIEFSDAVTATVEGVVDDDAGSVTGVADSLIEKPTHLYRWSILKPLALDTSVIDADSIDAAGALMDAAIAGGYKFGGIVQEKIEARELWQKWGKECRSLFYWDLGKAKSLYRPLNFVTPSTPVQKVIADSMIPYEPSTGVSIFETSRTRMTDLVNYIDMLYLRDWSGNEYKANVNKVDADSIVEHKKREKPNDFKFDWIRSELMADDIAGFYIKEHSRPTDVYEFDLFLDNMEVEAGDVVWVNPPTHELDNVKMMVLSAGRVLGSGKARRMDTIKVMGRLMPGTITHAGFGQHPFGGSGFGAKFFDRGFGAQPFGNSGFAGVENQN